jgi:predicted O-linked N-acetylglucosamine transferase (SPINDLY family)
LTSGRPTFGSFNNPSKLSGRALDLWAQILDRIPDTRLVLKYRNLFADPLVTTRIANAFGRRGVDPGRIEFATGGFTSSEHLALYAQVDVALDPFPFNGNTSTLEALWMGVPVVSLAGERCVSRMGLALLRSIGADEWAATSEVEYVTKAVSLAGKGAELATLRSTLRPRVRNSPLCDYHAYARSLESAYRGMYRSAIGTTSLRDGAAPPILVPDPT